MDTLDHVHNGLNLTGYQIFSRRMRFGEVNSDFEKSIITTNPSTLRIFCFLLLSFEPIWSRSDCKVFYKHLIVILLRHYPCRSDRIDVHHDFTIFIRQYNHHDKKEFWRVSSSPSLSCSTDYLFNHPRCWSFSSTHTVVFSELDITVAMRWCLLRNLDCLPPHNVVLEIIWSKVCWQDFLLLS